MSTVDDIFNAAQSLGLAERWNLVNRLWDSLPTEAWELFDEAEIALLDQRMADVDSGKVETIPWSEARRQMHSWLKHDG
jgi:putative addiction module component (TIGR02574 family)